MYQSLYRKWRSRRFADVVGQQAIVTTLQNQILADKIGHAYLFTGTRGTGKTTCAKLLAKAANCENREGAEPCGKCPSCMGMEDGSVLDVAEIDAASNNSVDDIRDLRDETAFRPSRSRYRVYIIDEVHMLSISAFNALLKILEEPPSHVIFILATTEIHKVPATILSRCQRFDFTRIATEDIAARLLTVGQAEGISLTPGAAALIARLADGAMRDAYSLLETCVGLGQAVDEPLVRQMAGVADKAYLFSLSSAVAHADTGAIVAIIAELRVKSIDIRRLAEELVLHYRSFLLALARPDGVLLDAMADEDRQRYLEIAPEVGEAFAIRAVQRLADAIDRMPRLPDPRIELELALFELGDRPAATEAISHVEPATPTTAAPAHAAVPVPPIEPTPPLSPVLAPASPTVSVSTSTAAPTSVPSGAVAPFTYWPAVVEKMASTDRMLYAYMKETTAFLEGSRVLIGGSEMFLTFMREYENAGATIKAVIEQVSGAKYGIGPYRPPEGQKDAGVKTAKDTLKAWEAMGVEVEIE